METVEHRRGDSGPMERSHMKDMVARNAMESAAYHKKAKHLDNQKKAFVRQNTRDEEEMKSLLHRLQIEQQFTPSDDEINSDEDNADEVDGCDASKPEDTSPSGSEEPECIANPYPVTIIPRFGGTTVPKQPMKDRFSLDKPGFLGRYNRRKSIEYEDIQDVLSSAKFGALPPTLECQSQIACSNIHDDIKNIGDWLAHPDAISSVRRMRKSVLDQSHGKLYRKSSNEQFSSSELSVSPPSSVSHSRNNSLKDRKRSNTISGIALSPKPGRTSRRGGSLKEHKTKGEEKTPRREPSFKKEAGMSKTSSTDTIDEDSKLKRKNSKKQTVQRKLSNDSTTSSPATSRKPSFRRKQDVGSEDVSPVGSPSVRESGFKY
ncbi:hypothetical protein ACF0H5_012131 [Mactra antiquata]